LAPKAIAITSRAKALPGLEGDPSTKDRLVPSSEDEDVIPLPKKVTIYVTFDHLFEYHEVKKTNI
jgi:hypothetical protein